MLGPPKPRRRDESIPVSVEKLIPADHFYRHFKANFDLCFIREWVRDLYAAGGYRYTTDFPISTTDPDATPMHTGSGTALGYHDHCVVDGARRASSSGDRAALSRLRAPADPAGNRSTDVLDLRWPMTATPATGGFFQRTGEIRLQHQDEHCHPARVRGESPPGGDAAPGAEPIPCPRRRR